MISVSHMKTFLILIVMGLAILGTYAYVTKSSLEHITVKNDAVAVDTGDYIVKFSPSGEFREIYMLFGGEYSNDKLLINPITLFGLEMASAKSIYASYPDFYRCTSPGAELAKPRVEDLNLIPADTSVLYELKETIKEYDDNFASDGDRVCVALIGKALSMQSAEVTGKDIDIKDRLQPRDFYLVNSSNRVDCKNLLDQ